MTIDELQHKKEGLEDSIRNLVAGFIDDTGLSEIEVEVEISPLKVPSPEDAGKFKVITQSVQVNVKVNL